MQQRVEPREEAARGAAAEVGLPRDALAAREVRGERAEEQQLIDVMEQMLFLTGRQPGEGLLAYIARFQAIGRKALARGVEMPESQIL